MSRSGQSGHGFCATSIWSSIGHIPRVFLTPWMPAALCAMRPLGSHWCACEGSLRGGIISPLRLEESYRLSASSYPFAIVCTWQDTPCVVRSVVSKRYSLGRVRDFLLMLYL